MFHGWLELTKATLRRKGSVNFISIDAKQTSNSPNSNGEKSPQTPQFESAQLTRYQQRRKQLESGVPSVPEESVSVFARASVVTPEPQITRPDPVVLPAHSYKAYAPPSSSSIERSASPANGSRIVGTGVPRIVIDEVPSLPRSGTSGNQSRASSFIEDPSIDDMVESKAALPPPWVALEKNEETGFDPQTLEKDRFKSPA
jgi:hypothetical protein